MQGQGQKLVFEHFLIFALPSGRPRARLGITVSRKVGNAVVRNRVKRLVREVFRQEKLCFPAGQDLVVLARRSAATVTFAQVQDELRRWRRLFERAAQRRAGPPWRLPETGGTT